MLGYILPITMYQYQDYHNRVIETKTNANSVKSVQAVAPIKHTFSSKQNRLSNDKGRHIDVRI